MKNGILLISLFLCLFATKHVVAGDARIVSIRVMNWGPGEKVDPNMLDFSWQAWLDDDESGVINNIGIYRYKFTPVNDYWVFVFTFDLQEFPVWASGQILHVQMTCNGITTAPWSVMIPSTQAASNFVSNDALHLVFSPASYLNNQYSPIPEK